MVTLRGILLCAVTALALLGACQDVPIDSGTGRVVPPDSTKDTTHTPGTHRDTCHDCLPSRERRVSDRMWFSYKRFGRPDTVVESEIGRPVRLIYTRQGDGTATASLQLEIVPPLLEGSLPEYWGIRKLLLNVPAATVTAQGEGRKVELRSDPYLYDDTSAGLGLLYRCVWDHRPKLLSFSTGDVNSRGNFRITYVDPAGRFIDARLEAKFVFPDGVHQIIFGKEEDIKDLTLDSIEFRLALR